MALTPPPNFLDLTSIAKCDQDTQVSTIGVVVDFLEATKSRGTDWTIKFTLHDHIWNQGGIGQVVRFFHKQENQIPKIQNQGDVVILRNVKLRNYGGVMTLLSNSASSWVVIENAGLLNTEEPSSITSHRSGPPHHLTAPPSEAEIAYARLLLGLEDPGQWQQPAKPTALQVAQIQLENGGTPAAFPGKFRRIEELRPPQQDIKNPFVDLFVEVRRLYSPDHSSPRVELSVTDYTEHDLLYKYSPDPEDPDAEFDGDRFRYIENTHKLWPGPWGKMTMLVVLWDPHQAYALNNIEPGNFVLLKNLQIKYDGNGSKLEGHMRTDRLYETRVNISVHKLREAGGDEQFTTLLQRKRDYEEHCKKQQLRFIRDAKMPTKTSDLKRKEVSGADNNENTLNSKSRRNRDNKRRQREKSKIVQKSTGEDSVDSNEKAVGADRSTLANAHVRINEYPVAPTTISSILDPSTLLRKTPAGNPFYLPFQNSCYKSKVRVMDFFPSNLEDFTAPVRESEYAGLEGHEDSDSDVDLDEADADVSHPHSSNASAEGGIRWQWRFMLLVEDARPPAPTWKKAGEEQDIPKQMELLVADTDGDYLLNMTACDLRKNPKELAKMREKLFILWGDLQEKKDEMMKDGPTVGGEVMKANAVPFECYIKEYGIPSQDKGREWERMFRLCLTSVVGG